MMSDEPCPTRRSPTGVPRLALDEDLFKRLKHARQGHLAFQYMTTGHVPYEVFENHWASEESTAAPSHPQSESSAQLPADAPAQEVQEQSENTAEEQRQSATETQNRRITRPLVLYGQTKEKRSGKPRRVRVKVDSGSDVNLVSRRLVKDCEFRRSSVSEVIIGIGGHKTELKKLVKIPLTGQLKKTEHIEFYEAPENSPFDDLLVGWAFEDAFGDPYAFFWDRPPEKDSLIAVQEKLKEEEREETENNRAQHQAKVAELDRKRQEKAQQRNASGQQPRGGQTSSTSGASTRNPRTQP